MPEGKDLAVDKPPKKDAGPPSEAGVVSGWNREAVTNVRDTGRQAAIEKSGKQGAEIAKDKLGGRDASRSWRELDRILPDPVVEDQTPSWLRPRERSLQLGKNSAIKISDAEWRSLKEVTGKEDLLSYRERSERLPFERGPLLFVTNPDTAELRWAAKDEIKEGAQVMNGNWVYKDRASNSLQISPRYSEDKEAIAARLRDRRGEPLTDVSGGEKPDKHLVERVLAVNQKLNRWTEGFLRDGFSLEKARQKTEERAIAEFKGAVWRLASQCLNALTPGGIPGPASANPTRSQL